MKFIVTKMAAEPLYSLTSSSMFKLCFFFLLQDVMKFMVTFLLIFLAFMVGLHNLYWYYLPSIRSQVEHIDHKIKTRAEAGFGT